MCEECSPELDYSEIFTVPLNFKLKSRNLLEPKDVDKEKQELLECEEIIKLSIKQSESKFLTLGEALVNIRDKKLYRKSKYPTFELYILNTFEMSKATAYRIIQVYEYTKSRTGATFENYTYSQIVEIVTIPEEDTALLAKITPEMSRRQIQKLKHDYFLLKQQQSKPTVISQNETPKVKKTNENITYEDVFNEAEKQVEFNEIQPLVLKNKEERLNFLKTYLEWEMIGKIDYLRLSIYRRRLKNKTAIIALRADREDSKIKNYPSVRYTVFFEPQSNEPNDYRFNSSYFNLCFNSENEIADYLTKHKKEIEWGKHGVAYFLHNNLFWF